MTVRWRNIERLDAILSDYTSNDKRVNRTRFDASPGHSRNHDTWAKPVTDYLQGAALYRYRYGTDSAEGQMHPCLAIVIVQRPGLH